MPYGLILDDIMNDMFNDIEFIRLAMYICKEKN